MSTDLRGWVEGARGKVHPWWFWANSKVVLVQRAFRVEAENLPFTERAKTREEYRLNPEH